MKKKWIPDGLNRLSLKLLLTMKLTAILVLLATFATFAESAAQKTRFTFSLNRTTVEKALEYIEENSDFYFFYKENELNPSRVISLNPENESINEVLDKILENTDLGYSVVDRYIVISPKAENPGNNNSQQQSTINGKITSKDGEPIPGASILIKGTMHGTVSDFDGLFHIKASPNDVLVVSFIGYRNYEMTVGQESFVDITLEEETVGLNEVVAIGYGTQRKGDVTSAVATVKSEDFIVGRISDAAELVKGKIAGLSVTKASGDPNAESSIMLRGIATLSGAVEPLVLIDGIQGDLTTVAPENIASFDVLKDASAAAIYGTRGANGVILITTKSGKRNTPTVATYNSYVSISDWYKTADFMDTHDVIYGRTNFDYEGYDTDWLEAVTRKAGYAQNHSLSLSGGSDKSTYAANVTFSDEEGIMRKSDRTQLRTQLDFSHYALNDIVKFNVNLMYGTHKNTNNDNAYVYRQALIHNPSSPVYNEDGTYYEEFSRFQYYNPVAIQNELIGDTRTKYARLTGNVTIEPVKGWKTNLMLSRRESSTTSQNYYTSNFYSQATADIRGTATKGSSNDRNDNLELTSTYDLTTGKHRFSALAGYSYLYNVYDSFSAGNSEFPSESYLYNNLTAGLYRTDDDHAPSMGSNQNDNKLIGFFGRISYGFDNRYNVLVSLRHEGSSKFGENNKWGNFPSASLGWTISNESFMEDMSWLSNLKLRGGFGITGVIPNESYQSLFLYDYDSYGQHLSRGGVWSPSLMVSQNYNPDLKWETTREFNIGLDWAVLNSRLSGSIDVYNKKTKDLLWWYNVPVPPNLYNQTLANVGQMKNQGVELTINASPVQGREFQWNTTLTLSHNSNKLLSLSNDLYETDNFLEEGGVGDPISVPTHAMEIGHRMGDFWGLRSVGVSKDGFTLVEVKDADGNWTVAEFDTSLNTEENRQRLGNGLPQVYAGWNNTFRYKGFDLSLQFTAQFGFEILNAQRAFYENNSIAYNRLKTAADLHPATDIYGNAELDENGNRLMVPLANSMSQGVWSDHIEKGDFVKLANATLGYTFPIGGKLKEYIQNLRIYASGQNLFTITDYSGLDPEVSTYFRAPGIDDRDKYPTVRTYTFGLSVNF